MFTSVMNRITTRLLTSFKCGQQNYIEIFSNKNVDHSCFKILRFRCRVFSG